MNARLYQAIRETAGNGRNGGIEEKGGGIILGDGRQRSDRCSDPRDDNWIGKASGYSSFNERHVMAENEIDFTSSELSNLPSSFLHGAATVPSNMDTLAGHICAPFPNIMSHISDNTGPLARAIEMPIPSSTIRSSSDASGNSCNTSACNNAPVLCNNGSRSCNIVPAPYNIAPTSANCDNAQLKICNSVSLVTPQLESCVTNTTISKNCQLGAIDVEDLAMCFDSSSNFKSLATNNRAIYTRRSKQARIDPSRQDRHFYAGGSTCDQDFYSLHPNDLHPCDLGSQNPHFSNLAANDVYDLRNAGSENFSRYCETISNLRPCDLEFGNNLGLDGARLCNSGFRDPGGFGNLRQPCDLESLCRICKPGQNNLEQNYNSRLSESFCDNCPELFNFCSEERWLQCPASDRCPLYDTSYDYGASVLPPCMHENLQLSYASNDNRYYDHAEDEQLLEDYL